MNYISQCLTQRASDLSIILITLRGRSEETCLSLYTLCDRSLSCGNGCDPLCPNSCPQYMHLNYSFGLVSFNATTFNCCPTVCLTDTTIPEILKEYIYVLYRDTFQRPVFSKIDCANNKKQNKIKSMINTKLRSQNSMQTYKNKGSIVIRILLKLNAV